VWRPRRPDDWRVVPVVVVPEVVVLEFWQVVVPVVEELALGAQPFIIRAGVINMIRGNHDTVTVEMPAADAEAWATDIAAVPFVAEVSVAIEPIAVAAVVKYIAGVAEEDVSSPR